VGLFGFDIAVLSRVGCCVSIQYARGPRVGLSGGFSLLLRASRRVGYGFGIRASRRVGCGFGIREDKGLRVSLEFLGFTELACVKFKQGGFGWGRVILGGGASLTRGGGGGWMPVFFLPRGERGVQCRGFLLLALVRAFELATCGVVIGTVTISPVTP
jgi:hypothetical protein